MQGLHQRLAGKRGAGAVNEYISEYRSEEELDEMAEEILRAVYEYDEEMDGEE